MKGTYEAICLSFLPPKNYTSSVGPNLELKFEKATLRDLGYLKKKFPDQTR